MLITSQEAILQPEDEERRRGERGDERTNSVVSSQVVPGGYGERAPTGYSVSNPL